MNIMPFIRYDNGMAILGLFIGVDRYQDARIPELSGAVRDASALATLFQDALPEMRLTELRNDQATQNAVELALTGHLVQATTEDAIIIFFSGHGTSTHRLVTYDAVKGDLLRTTVDMSLLVDLFKQTQARNVLVVLDCCFSGGAPAKAIESEQPLARELFSFDDFGGEGRIILAASSPTQKAFEHPNGGHGFLTQALMDVLLDAQAPLDVLAVIPEVQARVRSAALKYHYEQSPTFTGSTQGGFQLPVFRKGTHFRKLFPERTHQEVTEAFSSLAGYGFPEAVLGAWQARYPGLNVLQRDAVNNYGILEGHSLLVVAPTSSGKTFIGEMAAIKAVLENRKAVFLVPYRALANEKFEDFQALYGEQLGLRVAICTGDHQDDVNAFMRGKYDLAFLTFEMFLQLAVGQEGVLERIGLIVLDETQFIADEQRGIVVELILTYLRRVRERGIHPQLIALSAVIGNVNGFDQWLGFHTLYTDQRPVPLEVGVLDRTGVYESISADGQRQTVQLLPPHLIQQRRKAPSSQDVIVPLVRQLLQNDPTERVLIFRSKKGSASGAAKYLAADLGLSPATSVVDALPPHDLSSSSRDLRSALLGGTAFHNSSLTRDERVAVERAFRDPQGAVKVLVATTTVAAGVNTPARTVIIADKEFPGEPKKPFSVAEVKNMTGRAGRLGFNESGRAILLAETSIERQLLLQKYVLGTPEPMRSAFTGEEIGTWVLRLLAQVKRVPRGEVPHLLANTYGGFLHVRVRPDWAASVGETVNTLLSELEGLGLIEEEDGLLRLSLLGQAASQSSLSFSSIKRLLGLYRAGALPADTAEALLVAAQLTYELDRTYVPIQRRGTGEIKWRSQAQQRLGSLAQHLTRHAEDAHALNARCKRALVLLDWMDGQPLDVIENGYSANSFNAVDTGSIRSVADTTRFHLRSVFSLASVLMLTGDLDDAALNALLARLEFGLPEQALGLLDLPTRLSRGEILALTALGAYQLDDVAALPLEQLQRVLGEERASLLSARLKEQALNA